MTVIDSLAPRFPRVKELPKVEVVFEGRELKVGAAPFMVPAKYLMFICFGVHLAYKVTSDEVVYGVDTEVDPAASLVHPANV